jgi:hypothetical protein
VDRRSLGTQRINNEMYEVNVLNSFVAVPLREGELVIPPFSVDLSIDSILQGRRVATFRSQPLALQVQTPPQDDRPPGFADGNVGRFQLDVELDRNTIQAGEAVTITLRVRGAALMSRVRLPDLPAMEGTRVLSTTDRSNEEYGRSGWLEGFATRTISLLATDEGQLTIPPVAFSYWDPFASEFRTIHSDAVSVQVAGRVATSAPSAPESDQAPDHWSDTLPAARVVSDNPAPSLRAYWRSPIYAIALALPPLAFVASVFGRRAARRIKERNAGRRTADIDQAVLRDLQALDVTAAESATAVVALLHEYLSTRLGRPTRGQTRTNLREQVRAALGDEAAALVDTIEAAERARYGGTTDAAPLRDAAVETLRRVTGGHR